MPVEDSSFPEEAMVAIPTARRLSMAAFLAEFELSHSPGKGLLGAQAHVDGCDIEVVAELEDPLQARDPIANR